MRRDTAQQTDKRVRHMGEIIESVLSVKAYGWEMPFISLVLDIREKEMDNVLRAQRLRAINSMLYFCSPHVAAFAIFMVYFSMGGTLTLPLVFTTLSFLQILRLAIGRFFTRGIETYSEAVTSSYRIESFLNLADQQNESTTLPEPSSPPLSSIGLPSPIAAGPILTTSTPILRVKDGCFSHARAATPVLTNLNFSVDAGEILMVVGSGIHSIQQSHYHSPSLSPPLCLCL